MYTLVSVMYVDIFIYFSEENNTHQENSKNTKYILII